MRHAQRLTFEQKTADKHCNGEALRWCLDRRGQYCLSNTGRPGRKARVGAHGLVYASLDALCG